MVQAPSCLGTPRSVFEESATAGDADDAMLLDQAGKVGPSKKAAKPTPRRRGPSETASKTTPMKAAAPKAKKPTKTQKAAAQKAESPKAIKAAKSKATAVKTSPSAGEVATPKAEKTDVLCANEDTPAKVVANMSRKCVLSRAYHKELAASLKAGLCKEMAKENARQAHRKAADEYVAHHCID